MGNICSLCDILSLYSFFWFPFASWTINVMRGMHFMHTQTQQSGCIRWNLFFHRLIVWGFFDSDLFDELWFWLLCLFFIHFFSSLLNCSSMGLFLYYYFFLLNSSLIFRSCFHLHVLLNRRETAVEPNHLYL